MATRAPVLSDLDDLAESVVVHRPGDPGYDVARISFNGMIDRRPAIIVQPRTDVGVVSAIREARIAGLPIAVRGGGHSVAGHGLADGACVIDLRLMRGVRVDPARRRVRAQGGAQWIDLDTAAFAHGLAMPGGTFGDTGIGGLTLGGGIGWLLGTGGLTCDRLVRAEVVTSDGEVVIAGVEDGDPGLLWALRGGGGNFGIVTSFEYTLDPVGPMTGGYLTVPGHMFDTALDALLETMDQAPPTLEVMAVPGFDAESGMAVVQFGIAFQGDSEACEAAIAPLRSLRPVIGDDVGAMSYLDIQAMSGELPFGMRHYWKGLFVTELDSQVTTSIREAIETLPGEQSFLLIEPIHGQALVEPAGGAAFGARGARWNVSAIAIWEDATDDERFIRWARDTAGRWVASSATGAEYANYAMDEGAGPANSGMEDGARYDHVAAMYGPGRFARLRTIKRRYDPEVVFRSNHTIPPA